MTSRSLRRCLVLVAFLLFACCLQAGAAPVDSATALRAAKTWLGQDGSRIATQAVVSASAVSGIRPFRDAQNNLLAYIVDLKPRGFVVIPADNLLDPVLAFSTESNFSGQLGRGRVLADIIVQDIPARLRQSQVQTAGVQTSANKTAQRWARLLPSAVGPAAQIQPLSAPATIHVSPLLTTAWGQGSPYNAETPTYGGVHCVTGCVNTAMGMILDYFKSPSWAKFSNTVTVHGTPQYLSIDSALVYDHTSAAIAHLLYVCGVANATNYDVGSSGAYIFPSVYTSTFGYQSANWISGSATSWQSTLTNELDQHFPLQLGITSTEGEGHSVVCDGWGEDGGGQKLYHLNMGWNGSYNDWYSIPVFTAGYSWSILQGFVYNIRPNTPPTVVSATYVDSTHVNVLFSEALKQTTAEVAGNYSVPNLTISGATLQADKKTVRLTTAVQAESTSYTVTVSNVQDVAGAAITTSNTATWTTPAIPPTVVSATYVDATHVDVLFSETLKQTTAEVAGNYTVPGLAISGAAIRADNKTVRLTTATQPESTGYTVTVSHVQDVAGNAIAGSNTASWDTPGVPPTVVSATYVDTTHVDVLFDEALKQTTAEVAGNYSVPDLAISGAALQADGKTVRLTTAFQPDSTSHTVTVSHVQDAFGNAIAGSNTATWLSPAVPPTVVSATYVDATHVDVLFDEPVKQSTAEVAGNYAVPTLAISGAILQADNKTVRLTTATQPESTPYTVTVSHVQDVAGNAIVGDNTASWTTPGVPPTVVSATYVDVTHVDVLFSEALKQTTAEVAGSYSVPGLAISGAALQGDGKTVRLTTATQPESTHYTVTVSNVQDVSGNAIAGSNTGSWETPGVPPTVVSATCADATHVDVLFDEALKQTTAEVTGNYTVPDLTIYGAILQSDGQTVRLTTATQAQATPYTVTVSQVQDVAGNAIAGNNTASWVRINHVPTAPAKVELLVEHVRLTESIPAVASGSTDADNETLHYTYQWSKSTDQGKNWSDWGKDGNPLLATETAKGDWWKARARASDGLVDGPWSADSNIVTVINSAPPTPGTIKLTPASPTEATDLTVEAGGSTDADGDTVSYNYWWSKSTDGGQTWTQLGYHGATLTHTVLARGQQWRVWAQAYDGAEYSAEGLFSDIVTIQGTPPTVLSATYVNTTQVDVLFDKPVTQATAAVAGNYAAPGLAISGATLQGDGKTVRLTTATQPESTPYTVTVSQVQDTAGNVIAGSNTASWTTPGVPPTVISAAYVDATHVDVLLSEAVKQTTAESAGNYGVPGLAISGAGLQGDGRTVRLTTATQAPATNYTVTVSNVQDLAGNAIAGSNTASWATPSIAPVVTGATYVDATHVNVLFDKAVTQATAEVAGNFAVPGLAISGAALQGDGATVRLTTANQPENTAYTVTVSHVQDMAGHAIAGHNTASWTTPAVPPTISSKTPTGSGVAPGAPLVIRFSEPMTQAATQAAFSILPAVAGTFSWSADGAELTFTPATDLTYGTQYSITINTGAKDLAGNALAAAETWSFTTLALTHDFSAGTWLVGLPLTPTLDDASQALGTNNVAGWDAQTQAYQSYTTQTFQVRGGSGYWVRYGNPRTLSLRGSLVTGPVTCEVRAGWNLLGNPYATALNWSQVEGNGLLSAFSWRQKADGTGYDLVSNITGLNSAHEIPAWQGMWVYASGSGQVNLAAAAPAGKAASPASALAWAVQLSAAAGDAIDSDNFVGQMKTAAPLQAANPPLLGDRYVDLYALDAQGRRQAADFIAAGAKTSWDVYVETNIANSPVQVRYPDLSTVPSTLALMLTDLDTGRTVNMRMTSGYTFTSGQETTRRHLRLEARPRTSQVLVLGGVSTQALPESLGITYSLSAAAQVEITVHNLAGRVVATIPVGYQTSGVHTASWSKRGLTGTKVPSGRYLLNFHCTAEDGAQVQQMATAMIR